MKLNYFLFLFLLTGIFAFAQSPIGVWKTVDDETGKAKSHVQIYAQDGKLYGKVVKILNENKKGAVCSKCDDNRKGKPILGMVILEDLEKDGLTKWDDGEILDPNNGKIYDCYIELEEDDILKVRGYLGFSMLGRTQFWYRVK